MRTKILAVFKIPTVQAVLIGYGASFAMSGIVASLGVSNEIARILFIATDTLPDWTVMLVAALKTSAGFL